MQKHHRIEGSQGINPISIAEHIAAGERVTIQFAKSGYTEPQLVQLNELAKEFGRNLEIRFYSHHFEVFDAAVLRFIPSAQCVSIDCLMEASNLQALANLENLVELSLGVFELNDPDVLSAFNLASLQVLSLGGTRKCNVDLRHLAKCGHLKCLRTSGHTANISTICGLPSLSELGLYSIGKNCRIDFVSDIPALKSLRLQLGGRDSIAHITAPRLEALEVIRVKGLSDVGDLGRFENLSNLLIEDQIKLAGIKVNPNPSLSAMRIFNCKTLEAITGIGDLKALTSLRVYKTAIDFESLVAAGLPGSLKTLMFLTGKRKRDAEIRDELLKRGYLSK